MSQSVSQRVSHRSVTHATFTIERVYPASPARVFAAWADLGAKNRWASCHDDWITHERSLDFRVGGREVSRVGEPGGPVHAMEARYHDIVPDQRIVYVYEMRVDETRISVSMVTVELQPEKNGTRLTFTEQGAFLDGHASADGREEGTGIGLDRLAAALEQELVKH